MIVPSFIFLDFATLHWISLPRIGMFEVFALHAKLLVLQLLHFISPSHFNLIKHDLTCLKVVVVP